MLFIWETRKMLIIGTSLKSYLFISTKHRCLNAIKKQLYHERIHNHIYEKIKDQFEDPDYYFVNELTEHINKAIRELPDTYRDTFTLSRFGELTNTQIATKLGVSVKTVEYRISQALKILRVRLKDYLPLLSFLFGFPSWKKRKEIWQKKSKHNHIASICYTNRFYHNTWILQILSSTRFVFTIINNNHSYHPVPSSF